jgi:hypothetical protein
MISEKDSKPLSDEKDLAGRKREFQTLNLRLKTEPTMYSVDCLDAREH